MTAGEGVADIHVALVRVVSEWTESDLQTHVAESVGVALDPTAIRAVYLVGLNGGAMGSTELAEHGSMTRPTTSKLVSRLAAQGVVERIRSGRTVEVRLTEAGRQVYDRLVDAGHRMVDAALQGWAPSEVTQFSAQLARFVTALSRTNPAPVNDAATGATPPEEEPS
ncbi:MarR family winged helix-turn-helix transcriptional regulator [uncultured Microbacterium sp.]|uniref:MarR family winged helix-turn-helix transcriptional regulator n=1 Tax=Microbacterium algeriense TaxID=2615184 RepID=UPI0025977F5E|nr:MarR family transcriptional regulator [uncultured Microbacterium sp.]